jgi:hypothetical protein
MNVCGACANDLESCDEKPQTVSSGYQPNDNLVRNYLNLRKAIGLIGVSLPFVLVFGGMVTGSEFQTSISSYYHTHMGDVFVGSLCAIAVFLWSYRGYDVRDAVAGNLACVLGLGVALFPLAPSLETITTTQRILETLHCISAAGFFLVLAYFSIFLFRLSDREHPGKMKRLRNRVYLVCGYSIISGMVAISVVSIPAIGRILIPFKPVFWFEALMIIAFGISWFTKGETIFKDTPQ